MLYQRKINQFNSIQFNGGVFLQQIAGRQVSYFFLLFPTFWGLSYFFLLLGKIPTFSYFFRFLLKLID